DEDMRTAKTDDGGGPEDLPNGESLTVSGLISSLRESRGAVQDYTDKESTGAMDQGTAARPDSSKDKSSKYGKRNTGAQRTAKDTQSEYHIPYCLFNTHNPVNRLIDVGFSSEQSTLIMTLVKYRVYESIERLKANMLTKSDLENDAYLFRAALQELRTETQMIRKNDQAILESQAAAINRDIESLAQRLTDEVANLRSDIEIELNNHKHDSIHEMKSLDMELHKLASNYQIVLGEMKTDIETVKLESIRRGLMAAVVTTLALMTIIWGPELLEKLKPHGQPKATGETAADDGDNAGAAGVDLPIRLPESAPGPVGYIGPGRTAAPLSTANADDRLSRLALPQQYGPSRGLRTVPADIYGGPGPGDRGLRYRDHSHLNIQYDPTISAAEGHFGTQQAPSESEADHYDDWFDAFFYPPQDIAERRSRSGVSASLMDSDPTFDSARWSIRGSRNQAEPVAPASDDDSTEGEQQEVHIPINFAGNDASNTSENNHT
ncbi:hypothetical protein IWW50_004805, partial [Coemansia erecta]